MRPAVFTATARIHVFGQMGDLFIGQSGGAAVFAAGITRSQYVHDALGSTIVQVWRGPPDFDQAGRIEQLAFVKQLAGADRYPVFYLAKSMGSRIAMLRDEAADKWDELGDRAEAMDGKARGFWARLVGRGRK